MKKMRLVRVILLVVALGIFYFLVYRQTHPRQATIAAPADSMTLQVRSISVTNNLALGEFAIPARSTHDVSLTVDESQMRNARLSGYFSANNSTGVQVILLDENQYQRFKSDSTPSQYIYLSKAAANGTIDAALPHGGKYYLIFDNSSSESSVSVKANVAVRGEMVRVDAPPAKK